MLLATALDTRLGLEGCATAPTNLTVTHLDTIPGYRFEAREQYPRNKEDIMDGHSSSLMFASFTSLPKRS